MNSSKSSVKFLRSSLRASYDLPESDRVLRRNKTVALVSGSVATAGIATVAWEQPSKADAMADVTSMVTSLGGLAAAALVVALSPMAIHFAFKIIRRVMT